MVTDVGRRVFAGAGDPKQLWNNVHNIAQGATELMAINLTLPEYRDHVLMAWTDAVGGTFSLRFDQEFTKVNLRRFYSCGQAGMIRSRVSGAIRADLISTVPAGGPAIDVSWAILKDAFVEPEPNEDASFVVVTLGGFANIGGANGFPPGGKTNCQISTAQAIDFRLVDATQPPTAVVGSFTVNGVFRLEHPPTCQLQAAHPAGGANRLGLVTHYWQGGL